MRTVDFSGQNATEGKPTGANLAADIYIGQETNRKLTRRVMKKHGRKTYAPTRDPHQCISWDPDVLRVTDRRYHLFHQSGAAEGWNIRTPARGLLVVKGQLRPFNDMPVAILGFWALNSWGKPDEARRHEIVMSTTLPVIQKSINRMHRQGRTVIMEADANNIHWAGHLQGMTQIHRTGLDRVWVSTKRGLVLVGKVRRGPKTGVGPDMQHKSLNWSLGKRT